MWPIKSWKYECEWKRKNDKRLWGALDDAIQVAPDNTLGVTLSDVLGDALLSEQECKQRLSKKLNLTGDSILYLNERLRFRFREHIKMYKNVKDKIHFMLHLGVHLRVHLSVHLMIHLTISLKMHKRVHLRLHLGVHLRLHLGCTYGCTCWCNH